MVNSGFFDSNNTFVVNNKIFRSATNSTQTPPLTNPGIVPNYSGVGPQTQPSYLQNSLLTSATPSQPDRIPNGPINIPYNYVNRSQLNGSVLDAMSFGPVGPNGQRSGLWTTQSQNPQANAYYQEPRETNFSRVITQGLSLDNHSRPENLIQAQTMNSSGFGAQSFGPGAQSFGLAGPSSNQANGYFRPVIYRETTTTRMVLEPVEVNNQVPYYNQQSSFVTPIRRTRTGQPETFTTRIPLEQQQINNQMPYYAGSGLATPNSRSGTGQTVIHDAVPISYVTPDQYMSESMVSNNSPIGQNSSGIGLNFMGGQSFEPVGHNGQRFDFSTPRVDHFPNLVEELGDSTPASRFSQWQQPQLPNSKKHSDVRFSGVVLEKGKGPIISDAVPESYIPQVQDNAAVGGGVNRSKDKGKSPIVWEEEEEEEEILNKSIDQQVNWRQLPLVVYGADHEEESTQIIDAVPLSFRMPGAADADADADADLLDMQERQRKREALELKLVKFEEDADLQKDWLVEGRERQNGIFDMFFNHRWLSLQCRSMYEVNKFRDNGIQPGRVKNLESRTEPLTVNSEIFGPEGSYEISRGGKSVITSAGTKNARFNSSAYLYKRGFITEVNSPPRRRRVANTTRPESSTAALRRPVLSSGSSLILNENSKGEPSKKRKRNKKISESVGVQAETVASVAGSSNNNPIIIPSEAMDREICRCV